MYNDTYLLIALVVSSSYPRGASTAVPTTIVQVFFLGFFPPPPGYFPLSPGNIFFFPPYGFWMGQKYQLVLYSTTW